MITQLPYLDRLTVTTAGTPLQFTGGGATNNPADPKPAPWKFRKIQIRPLASNTGNVLVCFNKNGQLVKPIELTPTAFPLVLEASSPACPINLNDLYFDVTVSGEKVMIIGVPFRG